LNEHALDEESLRAILEFLMVKDLLWQNRTKQEEKNGK
jgi:hypothetical protein